MKTKNTVQYVYGVWHQFQTIPLHMKLCNVISVVYFISDQNQIVTFLSGKHSCTHIDTHAHTYMLARTSTSDSLVYNKMVVRMATARRRTAANRTALSAVTTGVSVLSGEDPWAFGWVGLACQTTPCHWWQVN